MQGTEERRLRRITNTPQEGAIEGNTADDILLVYQRIEFSLDTYIQLPYAPFIEESE